MKKILLLLLLAGILSAYVPEKSFSFNSGALIKASELNENEDGFYNAITDGQADLSIYSVQATSFRYPTTVTKDIYVSYLGFQGASYVASSNYTGTFSGTGTSVAKAQVLLPSNATITQLTCYATGGINVLLVQQAVTSTSVTQLATTSPTATTASVSTVVDNSTYLYSLVASVNSTAAVLYRAKISYTASQLDGAY